MHARFLTCLLLASAAWAYEKICAVKSLGGGLDDGPNINAAFKECSENAVILLDSYYSVNTLLLTEGLNHVDIVLSGTGTPGQDLHMHPIYIDPNLQCNIPRISRTGLRTAYISLSRTRASRSHATMLFLRRAEH